MLALGIYDHAPVYHARVYAAVIVPLEGDLWKTQRYAGAGREWVRGEAACGIVHDGVGDHVVVIDRYSAAGLDMQCTWHVRVVLDYARRDSAVSTAKVQRGTKDIILGCAGL